MLLAVCNLSNCFIVPNECLHRLLGVVFKFLFIKFNSAKVLLDLRVFFLLKIHVFLRHFHRLRRVASIFKCVLLVILVLTYSFGSQVPEPDLCIVTA